MPPCQAGADEAVTNSTFNIGLPWTDSATPPQATSNLGSAPIAAYPTPGGAWTVNYVVTDSGCGDGGSHSGVPIRFTGMGGAFLSGLPVPGSAGAAEAQDRISKMRLSLSDAMQEPDIGSWNSLQTGGKAVGNAFLDTGQNLVTLGGVMPWSGWFDKYSPRFAVDPTTDLSYDLSYGFARAGTELIQGIGTGGASKAGFVLKGVGQTGANVVGWSVAGGRLHRQCQRGLQQFHRRPAKRAQRP